MFPIPALIVTTIHSIADASVYPASIQLHNKTVNMIAHMWHAPKPEGDNTDYIGAGTVGSTEACLLAGMCTTSDFVILYLRLSTHSFSLD